MKRREAVRHLFIIGSAVWLFPRCNGKQGNLKQLLKLSELELLTDIAETVIPSTDTPGAKALGIQHFINKIITDCRSPEYQKQFVASLNAFEYHIKKNTGERWSALGVEKREKVLNNIWKGGDETVRHCIKEIRELTIKGYKNSEYYITKVQKYKISPGHFYGCVKVKKEIV